MKQVLLIFLCGLAVLTAQARLGDKMGDLEKRFGKPAQQPRKDAAVWLFEADDGQLEYAVIFGKDGRSVSERFSPLKMAQFTDQAVEHFIQLQVVEGSKTVHTIPPGQPYKFGPRSFVCAEKQLVMIDEANDLMIVWTKSGVPSVIAVRAEAL